MSKFNSKKPGEVLSEINHMGSPAFKYDNKLDIVGILLCSFVEDSYYRTSSEELRTLEKLIIDEPDKQFIAKAAIYARTQFGMRSISHVTAAIIAHYVKEEEWTKRFFEKVVYRVDDITEILSRYISYYSKNRKNKKLPNSMKKGLRAAIGKFNAYQLGKYKSSDKELTLIDAVNLLHPRPTKQNGMVEVCNKDNSGTVTINALEALMTKRLKAEDTWEFELSKAGSDKDKKAKVWETLLNNHKLGYMATLRNLRNIKEQAPHMLDKALEYIANPEAVKKSLVLPFRFISAYNVFEKEESGSGKFESEKGVNNKIIKALNSALSNSVNNIPYVEGKTIILSDNSGSMTGDMGGASVVSAMSNIKTADIANLFAVLYWTRCEDTLIGLFGDKLIYPELNRANDIFTNFNIINKEAEKCGRATEAGIYKMFRRMIDEKIMVDRIIVFSDCQIGDGCNWYGIDSKDRIESFDKLLKDYRKINTDFKFYSVDLKNYGTTVFNKSVFKIFGWSEKIFDIISSTSKNPKALIDIIDKVEL